jgi:hypothetical protein
MSKKNSSSFNHQVFQKAYKRLNLSSTNRIIFQRLLGFLIRNDQPFPYSAVKMAEITGFSLRTIFNSFNELEKCRLIVRIGMGKNRRFCQGSILKKIFTTVQNRNKFIQVKKSTTVQLVQQNLTNRATGAYNKTFSFSKLKEKVFLNSDQKKENELKMLYHEYVKQIESDRFLKLNSGNVEILSFCEWLEKN